MKKATGILCAAIFLASLGWKLTHSLFMVQPDPSLVDVGYLRVRDGSVLEFKNGTITSIRGLESKNGTTTSIPGPGKFSVEFPVSHKIDLAIYTAASAACLLAAIALLKPEKA
jgi:hypothetical protein